MSNSLKVFREDTPNASMEDCVSFGVFDERMMRFIKLALSSRCNILISGGIKTGKTTLLDILARSIPSEGLVDRVIVDELKRMDVLDILQKVNRESRGLLATWSGIIPELIIPRIAEQISNSSNEWNTSIDQVSFNGVDIIIQLKRPGKSGFKIESIVEITNASKVPGLEEEKHEGMFFNEIFRSSDIGDFEIVGIPSSDLIQKFSNYKPVEWHSSEGVVYSDM